MSVKVAGIESVIERVERLSPAVRRAVTAAVSAETDEMVRVVKTEKLSGQVLNQRSQRLVRSIHGQVIERPEAVIGVVGTNVRYAAYHEYGFHGIEQVREHLRKMTQAFGRPIEEKLVTVRAHTRQVDYPARSFLRSTLAEREQLIRERLRAAVAKAVKDRPGA